MAVRKTTFSIPNRSKHLAGAVTRRPKAEGASLARACDVANSNADVRVVEEEFDAISADVAEPWIDATPR